MAKRLKRSPVRPRAKARQSFREPTLTEIVGEVHGIDVLRLFAYADQSHGADRDVWRSFLNLVVPVLFQIEKDIGERLIELSLFPDTDEFLLQMIQPEPTIPHIMLHVSAQISEKIGLGKEFGYSAFLEATLPTRLYSVKTRESNLELKNIAQQWLNVFQVNDSTGEFEEMVADWKDKLDLAIEDYYGNNSLDAAG